jgi:NAD(P)-dependent dehydrogenase (short-subunit alcohol dehydrogenase family)
MSKALRVLITGAARGMGMATAQVLANRGHSVVATDVSALSELEGIQAHGLDVTSDDSVARCLKEVGPLDAIVNNAGIFGLGPVEDYPLDRFRQMFETNTLGPLRVIRAVLPAWRKRDSGVIVNVPSVSGRVSSPLGAAYSASKFALEALTESLHLEVTVSFASRDRYCRLGSPPAVSITGCVGTRSAQVCEGFSPKRLRYSSAKRPG